MQSSLGSIIKVEDNRRNDTFSQTSSQSKRFDRRDREGNDIFNFSKAPEESTSFGKKKITNH